MVAAMRRGDAMIAVIEASLDAGIDLNTLAKGMGYANIDNLRTAAVKVDPNIDSRLRAIRKGGSVIALLPEIEEQLAYGMTTSHVCEVFKVNPGSVARAFQRQGKHDLARRFNRLYHAMRGE